jgi:hypothetical protein
MLVRLTLTPGRAPEWCLIEIQGLLERRTDTNARGAGPAASFAGVALGQLRLNAEGDPSLDVGNLRLVGRVVEMDRTLTIARRKPVSPPATTATATATATTTATAGGGAPAEDGARAGGRGVEAAQEAVSDAARASAGDDAGEIIDYDVVGLVRKKLIFRERPKPIVADGRQAQQPVAKRIKL